MPSAVSVIRPVQPGDAQAIAGSLRAADVAEVRAASGLIPDASFLERCIGMSDPVFTIDIDGAPAALFGVTELNPHLGVGAPWLLATPALDRHPRVLITEGPEYIRRLRNQWPILVNFVHAKHHRSIRWLRWLGFNLHPAEAHGVAGEQFHRFDYV